jgi:hypothetical protein
MYGQHGLEVTSKIPKDSHKLRACNFFKLILWKKWFFQLLLKLSGFAKNPQAILGIDHFYYTTK